VAGYTTETNLQSVVTAAELSKYFETTPVANYYINMASSMIYSRIRGRTDIADNSALAPSSYNTTTDLYPAVRYYTELLTIDLGRWRKGGKPVGDAHPSLMWAEDVRMNRADVGTE